MITEEWRSVSGFEGFFEVSNRGRIRSVSRLVRTMLRSGEYSTRRIKSKVLALHTWGAKYPGIVLHRGNKPPMRKMIHQLVAEAFVPNPNGYTQINHIDANTLNSFASNLEWCNQSMNVAHAYKIGNRPIGKDHHFSRLKRDKRGCCISL